MMSNKINTQIPHNTVIGARQISKELNKLSLSREAMDYLSAISGTLEITISGETGTLSHRVIDNQKNYLCTTRELETLAAYKTFIVTRKEERTSLQMRDTKTMTIHHLKGQFQDIYGQGACPDRMLDANMSKFGQLKKDLETVLKNLEVIETLPASNEKNYLTDKGTVLKRIILRTLVACVGPVKLEQSDITELLFNCCIPQYIRTKFIDPNFTKDARNDAATLIFPRGNYGKTVGLTTHEANSDAMLRANELVISASSSIIQLARSAELRTWFISRGKENTDDLDAQWDKFTWPMLALGDAAAYLKPRLDRVNVKSFTPTLAPRAKPGDKKAFRPETAFQKEVRDLKNLHGKFLSTLLEFFHFIPKVDSPLDDFWNRIGFDTDEWIISPEMTLYDWIDLDPHRDIVLNAIKNNSLAIFRRKLTGIVATSLDIPSGSRRFRVLTDILLMTGANDTRVNYAEDAMMDRIINDLPTVTYEELTRTNNVTDEIRKSVNIFHGKTTEEVKAGIKRKPITGRKPFSKEANRYIRKITNSDLRTDITKWIVENFRNQKLQLLAAEYVTSAIEDENLGYDSSESSDSSEEGEE